MDEICRLCLADTTNYDEYTSYFQRIQLLMPEIDLNITPTIILCDDCSNNLNSAYTFKEKCLQIEERIKNYVSETQTPLTNLRCLKDQNYNDRNKLFEEVDVEAQYDNDFNEDRFTNSTKLDDFKDINSIKVEYNLTFPKVEIFRQEEIVGNESLKTFVCEICMESFNNPIELDRHRIVHSNINRLQDDYSEKDPLISPNREIFKCHIAEYATNQCIKEERELFMCEICKESFKESIELDQHRRIIHFKSDWYNKGTIYNLTFPEVEIFQQEEIVEHESLKAFVCEICMESFNNPIELDRHRIVHSKINRLQDDYSEKDPLIFPNREIFKCHIAEYATNQCIKEERDLFMCEICKEFFNESIELDQHRIITHFKINRLQDDYSEKDPLISPNREIFKCHIAEYATNQCINEERALFICEICEESFNKAIELDQHNRIIHFTSDSYNKRNRHICDICNKGFHRKQNLDYHRHVHHNKTHPSLICSDPIRTVHAKKHVCKICDMKFRMKYRLLTHMRTHTGDRPYVCEVCGKGFTLKGSLVTHMLTHQAEKPYICNICQKGYASKLSLEVHMPRHVPNPEKPFVCDIITCSRRFEMEISLTKHMQRHQLGKPHRCYVCDKSFSTVYYLKTHMKSHSGERPYKCNTCHKRFTEKAILRRHLESHIRKKI